MKNVPGKVIGGLLLIFLNFVMYNYRRRKKERPVDRPAEKTFLGKILISSCFGIVVAVLKFALKKDITVPLAVASLVGSLIIFFWSEADFEADSMETMLVLAVTGFHPFAVVWAAFFFAVTNFTLTHAIAIVYNILLVI